MSNVSKEQKARLYDQWGIISKLVRDGKRDPDEVSRALQEIISPTKKYFDYTESASHQAARKIMGKNFLGLPEVDRHFEITPFHREVFEEIPFSKEVLRECRDTHILVADIGDSILYIRERVKNSMFYAHDNVWYNSEKFARETCKPQWRLIRKGEVPGSTGKTWQEQQELLVESEEVSSARTMVYTAILNYLVSGKRMLKHMYVRTSSFGLFGEPVSVGNFSSASDGLDVSRSWDDSPDGNLGLASTWKS